MAKRTSGKLLCSGVLRGGRCTMSRSTRGTPVQIRGPCGRCRERRCRTHCRCGRSGGHLGRAGPRPARTASASSSPSSSGLGRRAILPEAHRRVAARRLDVNVFSDTSLWFDAIVHELQTASSVHVASYVMDDKAGLYRPLVGEKGRWPRLREFSKSVSGVLQKCSASVQSTRRGLL